MKAPNHWKLEDLFRTARDGIQAEGKPGKWGPARPVGFNSLRERLRLAWGVFTGRYDALEWWY